MTADPPSLNDASDRFTYDATSHYGSDAVTTSDRSSENPDLSEPALKPFWPAEWSDETRTQCERVWQEMHRAWSQTQDAWVRLFKTNRKLVARLKAAEVELADERARHTPPAKLPADLTIGDLALICHRHGVRFNPMLVPTGTLPHRNRKGRAPRGLSPTIVSLIARGYRSTAPVLPGALPFRYMVDAVAAGKKKRRLRDYRSQA